MLRFIATLFSVASALGGPQIYLNSCQSAASALQQWALTPNKTKLYLPSTLSGNVSCLDIEGFSTQPGAVVYTFPCGHGSKLNEDWVISPTSIKSMQTPPTCLAAAPGSGVSNGTLVTTAECSDSDPNQALAFDAASGLIKHVGSGLCVDAGSPVAPSSFCDEADHATWPICDYTQSIAARAADIVSRLTLADKYLALGTATPFLPSVQMAPYQ